MTGPASLGDYYGVHGYRCRLFNKKPLPCSCGLEDAAVRRWTPLVYKISNRMYEKNLKLIPKEDIISEGLLGLLKACRGFKRDCKIKFMTFAYTCVWRRLVQFCKCYHGQEPALNNLIDFQDKEECHPILHQDNQVELRDEVDHIRKKLTRQKWRLIWNYHGRGMLLRECALQINRTKEAARQRITRDLKELRIT